MTKLSLAFAAAACLAFAGNAFADAGDDLIAKGKCSSCHTSTTTKKAPSWADVAKKYQGDPAATDKIVAVLKTGGANDHNKVAGSDADLKLVAAKVLASK